MKRILAVLVMIGGLSACTPPEVEYCHGFGVQGTAEYGKCINYYNQQQGLFDADKAFCALEADKTYPPTLYDRGGFVRPMGGFSSAYWGRGGYYGGGSYMQIEPDYYHNAEVDRLRMRIIGPCMASKGWNSADSWQAGRHAVMQAPAKKKAKPSTGGALPWLLTPQ